MFAYNAQSTEVSDVLLTLLGNILYNADLAQITDSSSRHPAVVAPPLERRRARPTVYPIAFGPVSDELLGGRAHASFYELWQAMQPQGVCWSQS